MGLFSKKKYDLSFLTADMHSHLLPGIDDGVSSWDESLVILDFMQELGWKKAITTPHIMMEYYPNTPAIIRDRLATLRKKARENGINMEIDAAAEYYTDEHLMNWLKNGDEMLTWGQDYLLFELPFMNEPLFLKEIVFEIRSRGMFPVLAHPERYMFVQADTQILERYRDMGVLFQLNLMSLTEYYSRPARKVAEIMIEKGWVDFAGTDIHNPGQLPYLEKLKTTLHVGQLAELPLKNQTI